MRRLVIPLVLAVALAAPGAAYAAPSFVFRGHGWGHGIGMAQYGAYGFAQEGWDLREDPCPLLPRNDARPGADVEDPGAARFRPQVPRDRLGVSVHGEGRDRLLGDAGPGPVDLGTGLTLTLDGEAKVLEPPLRFSPGKSPLELGKPYRGSIVVTLADGRLQAVNSLNLEKYLYGVVPGEMPPSWHPEALKTQAVAARTYALVSRKTDGSFDVFADTRSQVYGGIQVEKPKTNAAVNATRGKVVLYNGELAWTFYSASSGGRTAAIQHVWPDSEPVPYLVSVKDPHDDISPYHDWGPVTFTAKQLAAKLGSRLPAGLKTLEVKSNRWGRAQSVIAVGKNGSKEISGWDMRILLGLRSTWFTIEVVGNQPATGRAALGSAARIAAATR